KRLAYHNPSNNYDVSCVNNSFLYVSSNQLIRLRNFTTSPTIIIAGFSISFAPWTMVSNVPTTVFCNLDVPICTSATGVFLLRPFLVNNSTISGSFLTPIYIHNVSGPKARCLQYSSLSISLLITPVTNATEEL